MRLTATITRFVQADLQAELRAIEGAVISGTREAGRGLKTELRRQVASAGLGQRLANSWRDRHYPNQKLDVASLIYTKAPQIIRAFDEDAVIRSRRGRFLAVPTDNAPRKGTDGRRISPSTFPEHRFGPLRFVPRPSGPSLLVVDGLRASFSRKSGELRGFRRTTGQARQRSQGATTVVMFLLVPQVKLSKQLGVARAAELWSAQVLEAMKARLETVPGAAVERNSVLPEKIPAGGLIILREGDPDEPEQALGGFGNAYYQHAVEIEVYVEEGDAAERDAAFDNLMQGIGTALEVDETLGGLAFGLTYGRPEPATEAVAGAPAIKSATLTVTVEYETGAPLA